MKGKKKLMPWEHEPWEEKRREAIREKKIIITSTQKHYKPLVFTGGEMYVHVTFIDFHPTVYHHHYLPVTNTKPERSGVKFKQILRNPFYYHDEGNSQGSWQWMDRTILYWPGKHLEFCMYHELGHFYNGDQGLFSSAFSGLRIIQRERRAWMSACLMIREEDIDEFVQNANQCLRTYDEGVIPITPEEVTEHRNNRLSANVLWHQRRHGGCQ